MRKRVDNNKLACGRTEKDYYKSCMNSDFTWKSNRLKLTKLQFYRYRGKRLRFRIHYVIICKKCGHIRQSGNCFGISVIKELLTGKIYF